jgi:nucleoside 2-deoxyribosyltransferase
MVTMIKIKGIIMKVYIAGPDVFRKNGMEVLDSKKYLCEEVEYEGLTPFDKKFDFTNKTNAEIRHVIYSNNVSLMKECDIIIADMNNFRHNEQDSGTIFEIGFGSALGKPIYIYSDDDRLLLDRTLDNVKNPETVGNLVYDDNGFEIENFGVGYNLMISESTTFVKGTFQEALDKAYEDQKSLKKV